MFCILHELSVQTDVKIGCGVNPDPGCSFCVGGDCDTIIKKTSKRVSIHELDWIIDCLVVPKTPIINKKKTIRYDAAIRLMHPIKPHIWILKGRRETTNEPLYSAFNENKTYNEKDLKTIMNVLKEKAGYDSSPIEDEDFQ